MTPERRRGLIRFVAIGAFGLVVFAISFVLAFPYDRIKDQLITMAAAQNLDVKVEHAGPVFGLGVALDDVSVRSRPEPGKKASLLAIDHARVHVSPLAQLRGQLAYDLALETMGGQIGAAIVAEKTKGETRITTRHIDMAQAPGVKEAINLTLGGALDLDVDITAPNNHNAEAAGNAEWTWSKMSLGDGKEKLKIAGNPLLTEGITLPRVSFGDFGGKVVFQKGIGRLQGVGARSADAEVKIEGEVRLADPLSYTYLDLYVMFKFSDALLKRADKLQVMLQFAESMGKRPDGFYGFRLSGPFGRFSPVQWQKTSPFASTAPGGRAALPTPPGTSAVALERPGAPAPTVPPSPAEPLPAPAPAPEQGEGRAPDQNDGEAVRPTANLPKYVTGPPKEP